MNAMKQLSREVALLGNVLLGAAAGAVIASTALVMMGTMLGINLEGRSYLLGSVASVGAIAGVATALLAGSLDLGEPVKFSALGMLAGVALAVLIAFICGDDGKGSQLLRWEVGLILVPVGFMVGGAIGFLYGSRAERKVRVPIFGPSAVCPILIRRAVPEDGPPVRDFVFAALRSYGIEPEPEGLDADVVTFGTATDGRALELVAEVDGKVVGSIKINPRDDGEGILSKFFVASSHRGIGVGRTLLTNAVAEARVAGYRRLWLETRSVFHQAIHLYESTGWIRGPDLPAGHGPDRTYSLALQ
jgi:ribosomal protein S18 acetylase RimI-like enzyme